MAVNKEQTEQYYARVKKNPGYVIECRRRNKAKLIAMLGGKCEKCGYCKPCLSSYHFHHKDRAEKEFIISRYLSRSFDRLLQEARKCMLLCANCHAETHDKEFDFSRQETINKILSLSPEEIVAINSKNHQPLRMLICENCKNSFREKKYKTQRFCQRSCRVDYFKGLTLPNDLEERYKAVGIDGISLEMIVPKTLVKRWLTESKIINTKNCPSCNLSFTLRNPSQRFCCLQCSAKSNNHKNRKSSRPSKAQITKMLETMSWTDIGRKYGVSDNAVRKWYKKNG